MIPNYFLPNHIEKEIFEGMELKTVAMKICFFLAMLYREGYCWLRVKLPSHLSSQNLMFSPLFSWKLPKFRNLSLTFIKPDQNCESPGLFWIYAIGLSFMYFLFSRFCQRPSSLISLNNHLLSKHWFWMSKFFMPKPPWSFGWHIMLHLASLYFFLWLSLCQKNGTCNTPISLGLPLGPQRKKA